MEDIQTESGHDLSTLSLPFDQWKAACLNGSSRIEKNEKQSNQETLRDKARTFFQGLVGSTQVSLDASLLGNKGGVMLTTNKQTSSHNEALAQLIAHLQDAFVGTNQTHTSRICALYTLCGAVEACASANNHAGISDKIQTLLGTFLLGYAGPLLVEENQDNDSYMDNEGDSDEQVRDAAILCLAALLRGQTQTQEQESTDSGSISRRLDLARKGVERRSAAPDTTDDDMLYSQGYDEFDENDVSNDIRGGLSTLPRSRRALCFGLVGAAIDGIAADSPFSVSNDDKISSELASFASFSATCLHGESDPRCLMQLLRLLHDLQQTFLPLFKNTSISASSSPPSAAFPTMDIFDTCAPYYPIQFTPPPNDVHGITREGLHQALMNILCYCPDSDNTNVNASNRERLNLSAGLFLERMVPPTQDEPSTVGDKTEGLEELSELLFPSSQVQLNNNSTTTPSLVHLLDPDTLRELSVALNTTHIVAASSVSVGGEEGTQNKTLADMCRTVVSKVAYQLEMGGEKTESLWNIFVMDAIQSQSPLLSSTPQSMRGRSAVAYLACLAASGGNRTLRVCMELCLPPLLEALAIRPARATHEDGIIQDEEKIAAAAYGVGAFFSSCRVAIERGTQKGVLLHPHPLEGCGTKVIKELCDILGVTFNSEKIGEIDSGFDASVGTKIAAVRGMESVLLATPLTALGPDDPERICSVMETLTKVLLPEDVQSDGDEHVDWPKSCSKTLGSVIGKVFAKTEIANDKTSELEGYSTNSSCALDDSDAIRKFVRESIYSRILSSACSEKSPSHSSQDSIRFDWMTLACACDTSRGASMLIIDDTTKSLESAITCNVMCDLAEHPAVVPATALSFLLRHGGQYATLAFHAMADMVGIINILCSPQTGRSIGGDIAAVLGHSLRHLQLPATGKEADALSTKVELAFEIVSRLLPAYQSVVPDKQIYDIGKTVSEVLPPLSEWDNVKLEIVLPILSAALTNGNTSAVTVADLPNSSTSESLRNLLHSLVPDLTEYSLSGDNDARARSTAASCLHCIITHYQTPDSSKECLSLAALKNSIFPVLVTAGAIIAHSPDTLAKENELVIFKDSLNLAALLGSAAACRGKSSTTIADRVTQFMVALACAGKAEVCLGETNFAVDLSKLSWIEAEEWTRWPAPLFLACSSAFGSIISVDNGGPFWRQRLSYMSTKSVLDACSEQKLSTSTDSMDSSTAPPLGPLVIACHTICSCGLSSIGKSAFDKLASIVILGLSACAKTSWTGALSDTEAISVVTLILATVTKIIAVAPEKMPEFVSSIVPNLLLLYSAGGYLDGDKGVPAKLMALQCLLNVTHFNDVIKKHLVAYKPPVVSLLADGLGHPSSLLRHAAVEVRLSWLVL